MRLFVVSALLLLAPALSARAVDCHPSEINLSTQAQVDQFQTQHGPCTKVAGGLRVSGANVVNVNGLAGLVSVESLYIQDNPALTSLAGLSSLLDVDRELWVLRNPALPNVSGLHQVRTVGGGSLMVIGNSVLASLQMPALRTVDGFLHIVGNPLLAGVGLGSLESVGGDVTIDTNPALATLNGLGALRTIGFSLTVRSNASLQSLAGLSSLESIGFALEVILNPALTSLGLGALESVGFRVYINGNPLLHSLDGLQSITRLNELFVTHSNGLTSLDGLASLREVTDSLQILFNPALGDVDGLSSLTKIGSLTIGANPSLHDVDGLSALIVVDRDLSVSGSSSLVSIEGLTNLTTVGGILSIFAPELDNLRGLGSVREVGSLFIGSGATTLDDLESLETVSEQLSIGNSPRLVSLAALHRIHEVQGLRIEGTGSLVDLRGLEGLQRVGSLGVTIMDNDSLRSLAGLDSLTQINGLLQIGWPADTLENRVLSSLDGLQALTRVDQWVNIVRNPLLADVDGLANLRRVGEYLSVVDNPRLGDCSGLTRLVDAVDDPPPGPGNSQPPDIGSFLELERNAPGCNSRNQILASPPDAPCVRDDETACLIDERFRVRADMWDFANGPIGPGARQRAKVQTYDGVRAETDLSVSFYAFEEGNVELFVKMLDACPIQFHTFWVFAAGATTAEAEVEVLDTWTGERFRVFNPRGAKFSTATGTTAFATCDAPPP